MTAKVLAAMLVFCGVCVKHIQMGRRRKSDHVKLMLANHVLTVMLLNRESPANPLARR